MIIKITQQQIDRSKPPSDGWKLFEIEAFNEKDSKDKQSKNWVFDLLVVEDGDEKGRYAYTQFNSKMPQMMIIQGFLPAALDRPIDAELEFDPDGLKGKRLYGKVRTEIYEGKQVKKVEEFASAAKPPF